MNEATFISQRTHTRVKFNPLTTACHLNCLTKDSPMVQTYDSAGSPQQYVPHRPSTPTVLYPLVTAHDPDGIFPVVANEYLSLDTIEWYVNGDLISEVWSAWNGESGDYQIIQSADDTRGMLKIYRNVAVSESFTLKFKGKFLDYRTNQQYEVESDERTLSTVEKGDDVITCQIDKPNLEYDPLYDDLLLYDYKVARGISVGGSRSDYINGKCFLQTFTVNLTSGTTNLTSLPSGMTMQLVRLINGEASTALVANSESAPEVLTITFPFVMLDMRMIEHQEYELQFIKDNVVVCACRFTAQTKVTMPVFGKTKFGADLPVSRTYYTNFAILNLADKAVDYPELYYLIQWYTQAAGGSVKSWQLGEQMATDVSNLGIGNTASTSYFLSWFSVDRHPSCQLITDEDGDVLLDEHGEYLIA